jgi:hypothetical protein
MRTLDAWSWCCILAGAAIGVVAGEPPAKSGLPEPLPAVYDVASGTRDPFMSAKPEPPPPAPAEPASRNGEPANGAPVAPVAPAVPAAPPAPEPPKVEEVAATVAVTGAFGRGKGGGMAILNGQLLTAGSTLKVEVRGQDLTLTFVRVEGDPPRVVLRLGQLEFTRAPGAEEQKGEEKE